MDDGLNETNELELYDIYKEVLKHDGIIIELFGQDVQRLRKGLSTIKSRSNAKLKDSGLETDERTLQFDVIGEDEKAKIVKLRIWLKETERFKVKNIQPLDGGLS